MRIMLVSFVLAVRRSPEVAWNLDEVISSLLGMHEIQERLTAFSRLPAAERRARLEGLGLSREQNISEECSACQRSRKPTSRSLRLRKELTSLRIDGVSTR
ncbi:hypothetical protein F4553_000767 [Allocatelliglobosispora scoriae]|uniref:Uncharacterized protein n=1 Tax=Allocatelliglobosispora scoriae TaxID=643052 RepID=A0A841BJ89_9ACTN|nr:hypothetical protein [Allocatelliglobosispora scoriae]MBB5867388.1 hypothetical protein [Allocatelliglobosispora scoriae]